MRYRGYFRRIEISLYIKLEVGKNIADIAVGDRVACAGVGYAITQKCHSKKQRTC